MKKRILMMVVLLGTMLTMQAQVERPKLVVGLMVDQMRWDYLYYYYDEYGDDGLKRLLREGYSCENTLINYVPTVTAIGHSSVYTGSVPAFTGISGNDFMIDGHKTTSVRDTTVSTVGAPNGKGGQQSPHLLLATTIGDEMKIATNFQSKVIGIAIKDRAAILPAGHAADAAYWYDRTNGRFVSSSYYMKQLPSWMERFNKEHPLPANHNLNPSNEGVTMTFALAEAAIEHEGLGQDDVTDLLAVSISSTDAIGHDFSTRGKENHDVYMQLDKDLAHFLNTLDAKVGRGNYLLFLTADHGAMHNPHFLGSHKMPNGGWDNGKSFKDLNEMFASKYGVKQMVTAIMDSRIYLDRAEIEARGLDIDAIKRDAVNYLRKDPAIQFAVDCDRIAEATIPSVLKERLINGHNHERSGDLFVVLKSGHLGWKYGADYIGTSHAAWNNYDAHIPLVFMGWNVKAGRTDAPTFITDIAATVCAMLRIQAPNCCIGNAIRLED